MLQVNESAHIDYFFKEKNNFFLLPNQPSAVSVTQELVHEHFYAIDGSPLSRRSNKVHWNISIEGFSGISKRNFTDVNQLKKLASVAKILESFEIFLQRYRAGDKKFNFFDLLKKKKYTDAIPVAFSYSQSVNGSRMGYMWQLDMVCYSEVLFVGSSLSKYEEFFSDITQSVDNFTSTLEDYETKINQFTDSYNRPVRELLNSVSRASTSTLNVVQSGRGGVQATRNTVLKAIDTIFEIGIKSVNLVDEVKSFFTEDIPSLLAVNQLKDGVTDIKASLLQLGLTEESLALVSEDVLYQLEVFIGLYGVYHIQSSRPLNPSTTGGSFLDKDQSYSSLAMFQTTDNLISTNEEEEQSKYKYILRAGDNLYRIAIVVYNDVSRWYEIAELNGWLDANTTASGYPPSAGDTISLPSDPNELGLSAVPNLVGEGSVLLTDLALVDGDLVFEGEDVKVVTGEHNFIQAVTNRIRTFQGGLVDDLEYGFPDVIGTTTAPAFISLQIVDQLLSDPRVLSVSDVVISQKDDQIVLDLNVVPFEGDSVNLIVPVGD